MSTTYTWNDGATNISKSYTGFKNGSTFPSVYTKPGKYKVTVTAKNTAGSQTASHTIKVQGRFYILSILGADSAYMLPQISVLLAVLIYHRFSYCLVHNQLYPPWCKIVHSEKLIPLFMYKISI